jgi:hypothetical protein
MRLPRVRFSVRFLMVLVLILGAGFGWVVYRAHLQRDAVAAIRRSGGHVDYFWDEIERSRPKGRMGIIPPPPTPKPVPGWQERLAAYIGPDSVSHVYNVYLVGEGGRDPDEVMTDVGRLDQLHWLYIRDRPVTDSGLAAVVNLRGLHFLNLVGTRLTNTGLRYVSYHGELRKLDLSYTRITDAGLADISRLTRLQTLRLAGTDITGTGLAYLNKLTALTELDLANTAVDDTNLHLNELSCLEELDLSGTRITDRALPLLMGLKNLKHLAVFGTKVTDAAAAELTNDRPGLELFR